MSAPPQRQQQQQQQQTTNRDARITSVNGIGLWNSWPRNFRSPLLAALDLIDNAVDATMMPPHVAAHPARQHEFRGRIHVDTDTNDGLVLMNNSQREIAPMKKILEVFRSEKSNDATSVGENGVGLKQGCATLADLSFCVVKNTEKDLSLGVLAKKLQTKAGIFLPSYRVDNGNIATLVKQLYDDGIDCVLTAYGDGDAKRGFDRLLRHIETMVNGDPWRDDDYVFGLFMHELRHEKNTQQRTNIKAEEDAATTSGALAEQLKKEIPRHYLHIPRSFDLQVDCERIKCSHWQSRLVELSRFQLYVRKDVLLADIPSLDLRTVQTPFNNAHPASQGYEIRVFVGFSRDAKGAAEMFTYSRRSGRLICHEQDVRSKLGVSSGSTDFCQGLTIIVDDLNGKLPLNPTKQDIAFGEEPNGETHRENLLQLVGLVTQVYWQHHRENSCDSKKVLTDSIKQAVLKRHGGGRSPPLAMADLCTFGGLGSSKLYFSAQGRLRVRSRKKLDYIDGNDAKWRLSERPGSVYSDARERQVQREAQRQAPPPPQPRANIQRRVPVVSPPRLVTSIGDDDVSIPTVTQPVVATARRAEPTRQAVLPEPVASNNDVSSRDNNQDQQRHLEESESELERRSAALEIREKALDLKERRLVSADQRVAALEQQMVSAVRKKEEVEAQLLHATNSRNQYRQLVQNLNNDKAELSEKLNRKRKRLDDCRLQLLEARKVKAKSDILVQREREQKRNLEHRLEEQERYYRQEIKRMKREHRVTISQLIKAEEQDEEVEPGAAFTDESDEDQNRDSNNGAHYYTQATKREDGMHY